MAQSWRKQASVAYGYSLTRLTLNMYMFYEEMPLTYDEKRRDQQELDAAFMNMVSRLEEEDVSLEEVAVLRKKINLKMETVIAFSDCFRIYEYALNRVERRFTDGLPVVDMPEDEFVSRVVNFLTEVKDAAVMNQRIQNVISQLPVRFTRQKYYGMVHDALCTFIGSDQESLANAMYLLRTSGMAELTEAHRQAYPELETLLKKLSELTFKDLTADGYRDAQAQIGLAGEQLFALSDYFQMMEEMVNDLYVIGLTRADAVRDASEETHAYGIIRDLCILYAEGKREIPDSVEEKLFALEGIQENYYEKFLRMDPAPEYQTGEDETAHKSRCVERLLSTSAFAPLDEKENWRKDDVVTREDVEAAFDRFVSGVDPVLAACQKPVVRSIMAATLSNLPLSFRSLDEIQEYIKNSLGSCTDRAEKETCMELLQMLMESEDYALV